MSGISRITRVFVNGYFASSTLLYLQLIMQMQTNMSHGKSSSNILHKPAHLLSFIKHVLDRIHHPSNEGLHDLDWDNISDEADSDDDTPGATIVTSDEEMTETSLNLLLSILEGEVGQSSYLCALLKYLH